MFNGKNKLIKEDPTELEVEVARAVYDLEVSNSDLKPSLVLVHIAKVIEYPVEVKGKTAKPIVAVTVPYRSLKPIQKVQAKVIGELEKKFKKHFVILGQRNIQPPHASRKQRRPRSRTLTSVHEALLEDIIFPSQIVGKRTRVRTDGSKTIKVFLDGADKNSLEDKTDALSSIYRALTTKEVAFEFQYGENKQHRA